jgi:hypothetical protein
MWMQSMYHCMDYKSFNLTMKVFLLIESTVFL